MSAAIVALLAIIGQIAGSASLTTITSIISMLEQIIPVLIKEYQDVGVDTFIMSGYPHLEEAYRFAELVFPLLELERPGNVTPLRVNTGPFGETIANDVRPHEQLPLHKQASQS